MSNDKKEKVLNDLSNTLNNIFPSSDSQGWEKIELRLQALTKHYIKEVGALLDKDEDEIIKELTKIEERLQK